MALISHSFNLDHKCIKPSFNRFASLILGGSDDYEKQTMLKKGAKGQEIQSKKLKIAKELKSKDQPPLGQDKEENPDFCEVEL